MIIYVSIILGYGGIENFVFDVDDIILFILFSFVYYGDNWYFDDFFIGYSLIEIESFYVDLFGWFNDDGFFFELDGIDKFYVVGVIRLNSGWFIIFIVLFINLMLIKCDLLYMVGLLFVLNVYDNIWFSVVYVYDVIVVYNGYEILFNGY